MRISYDVLLKEARGRRVIGPDYKADLRGIFFFFRINGVYYY